MRRWRTLGRRRKRKEEEEEEEEEVTGQCRGAAKPRSTTLDQENCPGRGVCDPGIQTTPARPTPGRNRANCKTKEFRCRELFSIGNGFCVFFQADPPGRPSKRPPSGSENDGDTAATLSNVRQTRHRASVSPCARPAPTRPLGSARPTRPTRARVLPRLRIRL